MANLSDVVKDVVSDFVQAGMLFTALDVSNKVKETLPFARHSEVRDLVRGLFVTDMEPAGYAKTAINVTIGDGSVREALLYHGLTDSWDLDAKYDIQMRKQAAARPAAPISIPGVTVASNGTISVTNPGPVVVPVVPASTPVVAVTKPAATPAAPPVGAHTLWANLFNSQPSLFPRK